MDFGVLVVLAIIGSGAFYLFMVIFRPEQHEAAMRRHHEMQMMKQQQRGAAGGITGLILKALLGAALKRRG